MTRGRTDVATRFEAFYGRERDPLVRALTFATGDPAAASDAVDEAMARAYQRWARVSTYDNPAGWVYRVALNHSRSVFRKLGRVRVGAVPDRSVAPSQLPDEALWRAVDRLPEAQRDAVVLRFLLDWNNAEIAQALDVPEGTIKSRVSRGLAALRERLDDTPEVAR